jgi:hypothetical protein
MKKLCPIVVLLVGVVVGFSCFGIAGTGVNNVPTPRITLSCKATPLKEVVDSVSKQTGYTIHVEESLLGMPITGDYKDIEITQLFKRIFRGENLSLLFAEKEKSCIVRTFGKKETKFYTAGGGDKVDPMTGLTASELKEMQDEQRQAFIEYSQDPEAVDQLTGLKLADLREQQEEQRKAFIEQSQQPDAIDPLSGKTQGEIKQSQEEQEKAFREASENPETVDALTGLKIGEIKNFQEQQRQEFLRYSSDPNSIDPLTGMSLGQLHELQEQQRREFLGKTE